MNGLDIFFIAILIYALYHGYKIGLLGELCGVLGLIIGVFIAYSLTDAVLQKIGSTSTIAYVIVFIILLGGAYIGQLLLARLISKALDLGGMGIINRIGGALASLLKVVLLLSIIVSLLLMASDAYSLGGRKPVVGSKIVPVFEKISGVVFPYVQLPEWNFNTIKNKIDNFNPITKPDTIADSVATSYSKIDTLNQIYTPSKDSTSGWNDFLESLKTK